MANRSRLTERLQQLLGAEKAPLELALLRINIDRFEEIIMR